MNKQMKTHYTHKTFKIILFLRYITIKKQKTPSKSVIKHPLKSVI